MPRTRIETDPLETLRAEIWHVALLGGLLGRLDRCDRRGQRLAPGEAA